MTGVHKTPAKSLPLVQPVSTLLCVQALLAILPSVTQSCKPVNGVLLTVQTPIPLPLMVVS